MTHSLDLIKQALKYMKSEGTRQEVKLKIVSNQFRLSNLELDGMERPLIWQSLKSH